MGATWDPKTRGTSAVPRLSRGEWLGGLVVVSVILGACWLSDALGWLLTGGAGE